MFFSTGPWKTTIRENGELGDAGRRVISTASKVVDVLGRHCRRGPTGRAVDGDTLFSPPSLSIKATTATALHLQAERGLIEYDAPIAHYWPEFRGPRQGTPQNRPGMR